MGRWLHLQYRVVGICRVNEYFINAEKVKRIDMSNILTWKKSGLAGLHY